MNRSLVFTVVTILLLSGFAFITMADGLDDIDHSRTSARKSIQNITKFNPNEPSAELDFGAGGGSNARLNITVPKRAKVLMAKMDVEGLAKLDAHLYDFNDLSNCSAWEGDIGTIPPGSSPSKYEDVKFDNTKITAITKQSDNQMATRDYQGGSSNISIGRPYHLFRFTVTDSDASKFNFFWTGEGYARTGTGSTNEIYVYIFNVQTTKWEQVDYQNKPSPTGGAVIITVDKETSSAGNYVDTNSYVYYMVVGPSVTAGLTKGYISTDYVSLMVHAGGVIYPSNVALDIGNDGTTDWSHSSTLNTKVTLDDSKSFKSSLQAVIDAAGTDEGTFLLSFKFSVGTEGRLGIDNLNISLEVLEHNTAPVEINGQLVHFYMTEDDAGSGEDLVDLSSCFSDDHDTSDSLIYEIVYQEDATKLEAELDIDGYHIDFTPAPDYYGTVLFRVNVTDSGRDEVYDTFDDLTITSNLFQVTVNPVNDVPELVIPEGPLSVDEGKAFTFNVTVTDPDDNSFTWDTNESGKIKIDLDDKDKHKVSVKVTPDESDTGKTLYFDLEVEDSGGGQGSAFKAKGSADVELEVVNLNDPPKFVELTLLPDLYTEKFVAKAKAVLKDQQAAREDEEYRIGLTVEDPDLGVDPAEELLFAISVPEDLEGELDIDSATGEISFTPANGDVGTVEFSVTVTDNYDETAEQKFAVLVKNRNDPPRDVTIIEPTVFSFKANETVTFKGTAVDDDLDITDSDEALTFMWFTNHTAQPLGIGEELINQKLPSGTHKITLRVIDSLQESAEASIVIVIEKAVITPDPGDGDDDLPDDDTTPTKKTDDKSGNTVYLATLAIVIIIVAIIAFVGFMKFRKKKVEEEQAEAAALEQQLVPGPLGYPTTPEFAAMYQQQPMQPVDPWGAQQMQPVDTWQQQMQMQYAMPYPQVMQPQFGYPAVPQQVPMQLPAAQVQQAQPVQPKAAAVIQPKTVGPVPQPKAAAPQPQPQPQSQSYDPTAINVEAQTPQQAQVKKEDPQ